MEFQPLGTEDEPYYTVPAVKRATILLRHLMQSKHAVRLAEVTELLGVSKSVAYGLLNTLKDNDFLTQNSQGAFVLGSVFDELRSDTALQSDFVLHSKEVLTRVRNECGETCHSAVLTEQQALTILVVDSLHELRLGIRVGQLRPLYCSSVGKVLLAHMARDDREAYLDNVKFKKFTETTITDADMLRSHLELVRHRGYAIDDEEGQIGGRCVAAPVVGNNKKVVAAISISGPTARFTRGLVSTYSAMVVSAARELSDLQLDPPLSPFGEDSQSHNGN